MCVGRREGIRTCVEHQALLVVCWHVGIVVVCVEVVVESLCAVQAVVHGYGGHVARAVSELDEIGVVCEGTIFFLLEAKVLVLEKVLPLGDEFWCAWPAEMAGLFGVYGTIGEMEVNQIPFPLLVSDYFSSWSCMLLEIWVSWKGLGTYTKGRWA